MSLQQVMRHIAADDIAVFFQCLEKLIAQLVSHVNQLSKTEIITRAGRLMAETYSSLRKQTNEVKS